MKLPTHVGVVGRPALLAAITAAFFASGQTDEPPALVKTDHVVEVPGGVVHAWEVTLASEGGSTAPVVIFLHGATWSGRPNFDLGFEDYSTMEHFAREGWDTFAVDARGYGQSTDPEGENWSEAADVVKDLRVVVEQIKALRSVERVHLVGYSWGSQVAALFGQTHPDLTGRVVLYGTRWQAIPDAPDAPSEPFRTSTLDDAKTDFIEGCCNPAVVEAYAKAALAADPDSPNGIFRDYYESLPIIDPEKCTFPTLIIAGEHEAYYSIEDITALFQALKTTDKQLSVLPGGGHAIHLEKGRHRWNATLLAFLGASEAK